MRKPVKFIHKENVEIISGFYKGHTGYVTHLDITFSQWFKREVHKYDVYIKDINDGYGLTFDEDELNSLDKMKIEFHKKLIKETDGNS